MSSTLHCLHHQYMQNIYMLTLRIYALTHSNVQSVHVHTHTHSFTYKHTHNSHTQIHIHTVSHTNTHTHTNTQYSHKHTYQHKLRLNRGDIQTVVQPILICLFSAVSSFLPCWTLRKGIRNSTVNHWCGRGSWCRCHDNRAAGSAIEKQKKEERLTHVQKLGTTDGLTGTRQWLITHCALSRYAFQRKISLRLMCPRELNMGKLSFPVAADHPSTLGGPNWAGLGREEL